MMALRNLILLGTGFLAICNHASEDCGGGLKAKTAILVHGAFADGSSWQKVIPLLEKAGLSVVAVQNPLDSLENDVASTKRAIANADGPIVLVGHSWGGVVITEAGNDPKVKSLVYVAAYAPDNGQSAEDIAKKYPEQPVHSSFVKDKDGYLKISDDGVAKYFAAGLPPEEQKLIAAEQGPLHVERSLHLSAMLRGATSRHSWWLRQKTPSSRRFLKRIRSSWPKPRPLRCHRATSRCFPIQRKSPSSSSRPPSRRRMPGGVAFHHHSIKDKP